MEKENFYMSINLVSATKTDTLNKDHTFADSDANNSNNDLRKIYRSTFYKIFK